MPRLVVTSDTHLGITDYPRIQKLVTDIRAEKPDLVAIAGDIGEGHENVATVLEEFASLGVPFAACSGNHDLWKHDSEHTSVRMWQEILPAVAKSAGAVWLDRENLVRDGVAVVGSNAWYDYSAQDPAFKASPDECWKRKGEFDADAWKIDWPWNDIEFCSMIQQEFRSRLEAAQNDPSVRSIVVVTHSPIFEEQITRIPGNFDWGFSNAYFGNLTFGGIVSQFSKVTHAVAGHTHSGKEAVIDVSGRPLHVFTLDSQYGNPKYVVIDL